MLASLLTIGANPVYATSQACNDPDGAFAPHYYGGQIIAGDASAPIYGVRSGIDPSDTDFHACTGGNFIIEDGGSSMWVAIVPAPGNPQYNNPNAIIQIGKIVCNDPSTDIGDEDICHDHPRQVYGFWSYGGCNGVEPHALELAPYSYANHQFWVAVSTFSTPWSYLLGHSEANRLDNTFDRIIFSDNSAVSCWLPANLSQATSTKPIQGQVMGERWDSGDDNGDSSPGIKSKFQNVYFQTAPSAPGGSWLPENWTLGSACQLATGTDDSCYVSSSDSNTFTVWDS